MAHEITTGTVLIKDNSLLPKELKFEGEPYVPGWMLVVARLKQGDRRNGTKEPNVERAHQILRMD